MWVLVAVAIAGGLLHQGTASSAQGIPAQVQNESRPNLRQGSTGLTLSDHDLPHPPVGASNPSPGPSLPVTNGLVRYWPNLFEARDEVTGAEGQVMGVIPARETGSADDTLFDGINGWVQLRPAITNEVNTLAGWFRGSRTQSFFDWAILGQQSEGKDGWWVYGGSASPDAFSATLKQSAASKDSGGERFVMDFGAWNHLAIARSSTGTTTVWRNGRQVVTETKPSLWPAQSPFLIVGNRLQGDQGFRAEIRGLCVFDRVLSDHEVRALYEAGVGEAIVKNYPPRLRSTARAMPEEVSRSLTASRPEDWSHRRFTTEQGLPGNMVQVLLQSREGYLWIGVEGGLARFDGRSFRSFDHRNTPAMRTTGDDILSLAEAEDGALWAGTFGGLVRVRGATVAEEDHLSSAPHQHPRSAQVQSTSLSGRLEFTAYTNGLPEAFVRQIVPTGDGWLWIAGVRNQSPRGPYVVRRYNPSTGLTSAKVTVPGQITTMGWRSNGVWISTTKPTQLLFWDGQAEMPTVLASLGWPAWSQKDSTPPTVRVAANPCFPPSTALHTWTAGMPVSAWLAELDAGNGVQSSHWQWRNGSIPEVCLEASDPYGDLFLGGSGGLMRLRNLQMESILTPNLPKAPHIVALCSTREGGVWFGTEEDGLHLTYEKLVQTFTTKDGLPGNEIQCIATDSGGNLWVATDRGLSKWQPKQGLLTDSRRICCMISPPNGPEWCVWERTGDPIGRISSEGKVEPYFAGLAINEANAMVMSTQGKLWVAHSAGLSWIRPEAFRRDQDGVWRPHGVQASAFAGNLRCGRELPGAEAVGVIEDRDGTLWVGSKGGGLTRIVRRAPGGLTNTSDRAAFATSPDPDSSNDTLELKTFTTQDGLAVDYCFPALIDNHGALWISGAGGLTRHQNGRFQAIRPENGLPDDILSAAIEDGLGYLWFAGRKGIHRLSLSELEDYFSGRRQRVSTLSLSVREGLITPECTIEIFPTLAKTSDGHIWVATRSGVASFDPRRAEIHARSVPVIIERLVVNRQDATFDSHNSINTTQRGTQRPPDAAKLTSLPAGSGRRVEIHIAAISFNEPERVEFRYRLDGHDTDWSEPGDLRVAFYTNLRPGKYLFRAQATRNHGQWSDQEATLRFVISPHFWETNAFVALIVGTLCIGALGYHLRRLVLLRQQHAVERRESLTAERVRIAADMHDDLGPTLTQIAILGEAAKRQIHNGSDVYPTLDRISQSARNLAMSVSDLNWATNPSYDGLDNLAAYIREQAARQLEDGQIQARLEFQDTFPDVHLSSTFRRNLILIAKEAINNALKHAHPTEVSISLHVSQGRMRLCIANDGRGALVLQQGLGRPGNGLDNMKRRAAELGGTLTLHAAPGERTTVELDVPLVLG